MARDRHVHKFICVSRKGHSSKLWKCAIPDCTWFVHLGLSHVMLGKPSICWECGETFIVDEGALDEDQPRCPTCRLTPTIQPVTPPEETGEWRTPEQQKAYEKQMKQLFGNDWRTRL